MVKLKNEIPQKIRSQVVDYLDLLRKNNIVINEAYLFGSYAKGNEREFSDIDLCIISDSLPSNSFEALIFLGRFTLQFEKFYAIEAHGFRSDCPDDTLSGLFINEVKTTGIRLI
ncbi:MAG: nucleotidyltransferase domain-containing protein [Candidatus Doudnabacteria bacterium]|nr:nucleotidyltransferase domain-containing protein [Candidatus Doudnabacteria bacterium]